MEAPQRPGVVGQTQGMVGQFFAGVGLLARGLGMYARNPRLVLLGLIPAVISGILFVTAYGMLIYFISDIAAAVTWFADDWSESGRDLARFLAGLGLLGIGGLLAILTFTAVTLLIGDPFYETISEMVEHRFGDVVGEVEVPWWVSLRRSVWDSLRLITVSVLVGIPLFLCGFIPVVGQTVIPVIGALFGGWFLAQELVGAPFYRRGMRLPDRRHFLRAHRPLALGFGVAVFCCFLIPLGAVLVMPAAVAGGTLLARRVLNLPITDRPAPTR